MGQETRTCQNCKNQFTIEAEDLNFYKKLKVPPPTFCPDCRLQRRYAFRNERALYRRKCDLTGEPIVSLYPEQAPFPVYSQKAWWGDGWDPKSYARDYDFSRPFFEQFADLMRAVPHLSLMNRQCVNSDYCPWSINYKNSFLCVSGNISEDCYYDLFARSCKGVFDSLFIYDSELCYECSDSKNLYSSAWCTRCIAGTNLWFSEDCVNCSDCFGCVGLRNKRYYLFNQSLTKEAWEQEVQGLRRNLFANMPQILSKLRKLQLSFPHKFAQVIKCVNSSGDHLMNSKNAKFCFDGEGIEDGKWVINADYIKDSYDVDFFIRSELCYEGLSLPYCYNTYFSNVCWSDQEVYYSDYCFDSNNLFGCVGLKNSSYCILNKQYEENDYRRLVQEIIEHMKKTGEWGEFFPASLSPFGYNETAANDYFPLDERTARDHGFKWADRTSGLFGKETVKWEAISQSINEIPDSFTDEILACVRCGKNFRIWPYELAFYKRLGIFVPRQCPECRYLDRIGRRNPRKLWHRQCACGGVRSENGAYKNTTPHLHGSNQCPNEFETSYAPDRQEIVYCEQCYNAEVA